MSIIDSFYKRAFDFFFACVGLIVFWPVIFVCWFIATIETRSNGIFKQERVGRYGRSIYVLKIKTMHDAKHVASAITALNTARITRSGAVFRRYKLDELPQFWNVLRGDMSFVGPRPDVKGYADRLEGDDAVILKLRPGITGPASLKYHNEESILAAVDNPKLYNDSVIWPDKVSINREYYAKQCLSLDVRIIIETLLK